MHGSGNTPDGAPGVKDPTSKIAKDYWKEIIGVTLLSKTCQKVAYADFETVNRGWDNAGVIDEYCGAIATSEAHVVFTHSFGNLVVAAGVAQGKSGCAKISKSKPLTAATPPEVVHWYGVEGPLRGSPAADKLHQECEVEQSTLAKAVLDDACDTTVKPFKMKTAYASVMTTYASTVIPTVQLSTTACGATADCKTIADIAKENMKGEMCGFTSLGELTLTAAALTAASHLVGAGWGVDEKTAYPTHGNDGFVGFESCKIDGATYGQVPSDPFYALDGNHAKGTCRKADDPAKPTQQPCAWYTKMCDLSNGDLLSSHEPAAPAVPEPNQSVAEQPVEEAAGFLAMNTKSSPLLQHQKSQAPKVLLKKMRAHVKN